MADFPKVQQMFAAALRQAAEESGMLLGQTLSVGAPDCLNSNKATYFSDMEDAVFVVAVESKEAYSGRLYIIFPLRDAIIMSSTLLGIPPARISEKCRLMIMENDDVDAFSEIANQMIGSFNSVLQPSLPSKVHLKQLPPLRYIPHMDELTADTPVPDGDYYMLRAPFEIQGQEASSLDLLIPLDLANLFDPQAEDAPEPEAVQGEEAVVHSEDVAAGGTAAQDDGLGAVLIVAQDARERDRLAEIMASHGFVSAQATSPDEIKEIFENRRFCLVLAAVDELGDFGQSICSNIRSCGVLPVPPIILSSERWTRVNVLKAVRSGARDILLKPYDAEAVVKKVGHFLHAA